MDVHFGCLHSAGDVHCHSGKVPAFRSCGIFSVHVRVEPSNGAQTCRAMALVDTRKPTGENYLDANLLRDEPPACVAENHRLDFRDYRSCIDCDCIRSRACDEWFLDTLAIRIDLRPGCVAHSFLVSSETEVRPRTESPDRSG